MIICSIRIMILIYISINIIIRIEHIPLGKENSLSTSELKSSFSIR